MLSGSSSLIADLLYALASDDMKLLSTLGQRQKGKERARTSTTPSLSSDIIDLTLDPPATRQAPSARPTASSLSTPRLDSMISKAQLSKRSELSQTQSPQSIPSSTPSPASIFSTPPRSTSQGSTTFTSPPASPPPRITDSKPPLPSAPVHDIKALILSLRAEGKLKPPRDSWDGEAAAKRARNVASTSRNFQIPPSRWKQPRSHFDNSSDDVIRIDDDVEMLDITETTKPPVSREDAMDVDSDPIYISSSPPLPTTSLDKGKGREEVSEIVPLSLSSAKKVIQLQALAPEWLRTHEEKRQGSTSTPKETIHVKAEEDVVRAQLDEKPIVQSRKKVAAKRLGPKARKKRELEVVNLPKYQL